MAIIQSWKNFHIIVGFIALLTVFNCISVAESEVSCFECSSVNDTYCPEFMTNDDESVVPMNSCKYVHQGEYCIKETGVTAGTGGLSCYHCDETKDVDFGCSDLLFGATLHDCSDVFDAQYCIKATGIYAGCSTTNKLYFKSNLNIPALLTFTLL
ncbi:unnamed protein product [Allacma fusca]|uniref:Sodefrin-like factor n=1 Tax=Allacma fusca TaxID=39272 RepID=A0A8J2KX95_9HEXA|nr:unnamed protein product [Allacma fusca]